MRLQNKPCSALFVTLPPQKRLRPTIQDHGNSSSAFAAVKAVQFRLNFPKEAAVAAGVRHAVRRVSGCVVAVANTAWQMLDGLRAESTYECEGPIQDPLLAEKRFVVCPQGI